MILVWAAVVALGSIAMAEDQPWAVGITEQTKKDAQTKLEQGNAAFLKRDYKEALVSYREAIKLWDHPAIRFNIVRCLIQLEQPVEAAENLEAALKYGSAPLEEAVYNEALSYQKLFASQIGDLELTCTQEGTKVSLDGQVVIDKCPGKVSRRVKPGAHQVVGVNAGFLTSTSEVKVVGGEHDTAEIKLIPLAQAAKVTHKWAVWKPWVVFGGGLTVLAFGGVLDVVASSSMSQYDRQVSLVCAPNGCAPNDPRLPDKSSAEHQATAAYVMMGVGAAATVTGVVMLYMNRGQTVYEKAQIEVTPTPGGAAVSYSGSF